MASKPQLKLTEAPINDSRSAVDTIEADDAKEDVISEPDVDGEEDDTAWELSLGIPQPSDPVLTKYHQGRDALIAQENKHRSDETFRTLLSPLAREASSIVSSLRFAESQTIWSSVDDELALETGQDIFPGMMFQLAKERMESTKIWQIVRRMPKGALLHCHLEAMVDFEWVFRTALEEEGMCVAADRPILTAEDCEDAELTFRYSPSSTTSTISSTSLYDKSYTPNTPIPLSTAATSFPSDPNGEGGGTPDFIDWLSSRCRISTGESLNHAAGPNAIWARFLACFNLARQIIYYEPIFRKFIRYLLTSLLEDGIRYVDIRAAFNFSWYPTGSTEASKTYTPMLDALSEEIAAFRSTPEGSSFWNARLIWTSIRSLPPRALIANMRACISAKTSHPDLIAGYDLVGQEDAGPSLNSLSPYLLWFRKTCAQAGVSIPFFFHAGETCGSGTDPDLNLFDAIILGTRRIGHGFSLFKHPLLMNMVKDRRILIEVSPISNEILRLTSSISSHPLPALLAQGVPVALCNDDPAMLGQVSSGLSHDYFQALQGIESLELAGLGALAENSVRWAVFEDEEPKVWAENIRDGAYSKAGGEKASRLKEWHSEWEKFCQWVVLEFGADVDVEAEGEE